VVVPGAGDVIYRFIGNGEATRERGKGWLSRSVAA
jgi:hypothetical protein